MKKTKFFNFLKDEKARVPFSVIGVFLILGSSLTTVYVTNLENQKSVEIAGSVDSSKIESLLRRAEADMATALNIAGLKGLKIIGEKPVIEFSDSHGYGSSASEINKNRVKQIIMNNLNIYLKNNYHNNIYNNSCYSLNVLIDPNENNPIITRDEITIDDSYNMQINRSFTIDLMGPPPQETHKTYWKASIPVDVEIKKLDSNGNNELVTKRTINVEALLTSRYNLLKELSDDYQDEISGTPCSLWTFCTALFNIYSLARGFQHWKGGTPKNVVDNDDLHPMVNAGLLMQQGFVFGSVDPWALANVALGAFGDPNIINNNKKKFDDLVDDIGDKMETGSDYYEIATDEINQVSADGSNNNKHKLNYNPKINIKNIARDPIEKLKSVVLHFDNCGDVTLTEPTYTDINTTIMNKKNQGCKHTKTTEKDVVKNQTTRKFLENLSKDVYTAKFKTDLTRGQEDIIFGNHDNYPIDNGTTTWDFENYKKISFKFINHPDPIKQGDVLYEEVYETSYNRDHFWSDKHTDKNGNVTWNETTVEDKKTEMVWLKIVVVDYCEYDTKNDVFNIFKPINLGSYTDSNLENTPGYYLSDTFTTSNIESWLKNPTSGTVHTDEKEGNKPNKLMNLCWDALYEIYDQVKQIKQNPDINPSNYPNPADLIDAAKTDLLNKFRTQKSVYLSKADYIKPNGEFKSASNKAIYKTREWYVNKIEQDIENYFDGSANEINNQISDALKNTNAQVDDVKKALSRQTTDELKRQLEIPFGFDMDIYGSGNNLWDEDIKLLVDQDPEYLTVETEIDDEIDNTESYYPLKLRNRCLFGPSGIPILPTPVTPWIFTFNIWTIDVEGEYTKFEIKDKTDETIYNVSIGHEAQVYMRQHEMIKSPEGTTIGENTRLNFAWTTVATSFVPPMGQMVGDTEGDIWNECTDGFD